VITAQNVALAQCFQHLRHWPSQAQYSLVKGIAVKGALHALDPLQFFNQLVRAVITARRHAFKTFGSQQRKMNLRRRDHQALIGADVGSRLRAADVLLAYLQGKHESGVAGGVGSATDDASGHLTHVRLFATLEAEIRTAGSERRA
jgi:hypothetical protein